MNKSIFYILLTVVILIGGGLYFRQNRVKEAQSTIPERSSLEENTNSKIAVECEGVVTPQLTEGPYYKASSPERTNFLEEGIQGESIAISGYVLNTDCEPIPVAWLDFWQADERGVYDNVGFRLRGHQFTNQDGRYRLTTVIPKEYSGRTPHIHVKLRRSEQSPILTTQLFFPDKSGNQTDSIFNQELVMKVEDKSEGIVGNLNFVLGN